MLYKDKATPKVSFGINNTAWTAGHCPSLAPAVMYIFYVDKFDAVGEPLWPSMMLPPIRRFRKWI
jgi:hypothetical protein